MAVERADLVVDFSFAELVEVSEEFQHVRTAAAAEGEWRAVIAQILAECVPVAAFLVLVAADCGAGRRNCG